MTNDTLGSVTRGTPHPLPSWHHAAMVIEEPPRIPGPDTGGREMEKRISPKPPTEDAPQKKAAGVEKTSAKRAKRTKKAKRTKRTKRT